MWLKYFTRFRAKKEFCFSVELLLKDTYSFVRLQTLHTWNNALWPLWPPSFLHVALWWHRGTYQPHVCIFMCVFTPTPSPPPSLPPPPPSSSDVFSVLTLCTASTTSCGFCQTQPIWLSPFGVFFCDNMVYIFQLNFYSFVFLPLLPPFKDFCFFSPMNWFSFPRLFTSSLLWSQSRTVRYWTRRLSVLMMTIHNWSRDN